MVRGVSEREALLTKVADTYDAFRKARDAYEAVRKANPQSDASTARAASEEARTAYSDAVEALRATNLPRARIVDVLELKPGDEARDKELNDLRTTYKNLADKITALETASDAYSEVKGMLSDPSDLQRLLRGAGVLEFRILPRQISDNPSAFDTHRDGLRKQGPRYRSNYVWLPIENPQQFLWPGSEEPATEEEAMNSTQLVIQKYTGKWYVLAGGGTREAPDRSKGLLASKDWALKRAIATRDYSTNRPAVDFQLNARGGAFFQNLTENNLKQQLCIVLDDTAISQAIIQSKIRDRGQITGDFTPERVQYIVSTLQAGSLPARLMEPPLMIKSIGPSLGETNRTMGTNAAIYGLIAVVVVMLGYYLFAGFVADLAVAMNLLLVLGMMSALQATFTLPGIAGLILTVGMAVDANVLIFERIREELERGASLRMAVKLGYEKAFSTIFDANITTLITCVILGYVGSEEIKGFALVLGIGITTSMFTALFVTRLIITHLWVNRGKKTLPMLQLIRRPNIDWLAKRRTFWPISIVLGALGLTLVIVQPADRQLDIEFLGGTSAQIEFRKNAIPDNDEEVRLTIADTADTGAVGWLAKAADRLGSASVAKLDDSYFEVTGTGLSGLELAALLEAEPELAEQLEAGSLTHSDNAVQLRTRSRDVLDDNDVVTETIHLKVEDINAAVVRAADYARAASRRLASARVQTVEDAVAADDDAKDTFEIVTTETSKKLVQAALVKAFGERLNIQAPIPFRLVTTPEQDPPGAIAIEAAEGGDGELLLGDLAGVDSEAVFDVTAMRGGVAMVFELTDRGYSTAEITQRIDSMRLQPDYDSYKQRTFAVFGLTSAGTGPDGNPAFSKIAVAVYDENVLSTEDPDKWVVDVALPELRLMSDALNSEQTLRKVAQFAPQIAGQATNQAVLAILLALAAIVAFIWIRFGSMQFGLAAIVALVHDVTIALGLVTATYWLHQTFLGPILGITDIKIDLAMVAAFLTIIGYSLNDTIVVFDRIRENRGKLATLSPQIMNTSINQCLSRTIMTSLTTFVVVLVMYIFGGAGIHGFSFALIIGVVVGTYSSVAIAPPLLGSPHALRRVCIVLAGLAVVGMSFLVPAFWFRVIVGGAAAAIALGFLVREIVTPDEKILAGARA
jgi:SecD/SecF fusion protein